MGRRLKITEYAITELREIRKYYKNYPKRAREIKNNILKGYATLKRFPFSGVLLDLSFNQKNYRSLVVDKQYRLIYYVDDNYITIISFWDCRQNPLNLFDVLHQAD